MFQQLFFFVTVCGCLLFIACLFSLSLSLTLSVSCQPVVLHQLHRRQRDEAALRLNFQVSGSQAVCMSRKQPGSFFLILVNLLTTLHKCRLNRAERRCSTKRCFQQQLWLHNDFVCCVSETRSVHLQVLSYILIFVKLSNMRFLWQWCVIAWDCCEGSIFLDSMVSFSALFQQLKEKQTWLWVKTNMFNLRFSSAFTVRCDTHARLFISVVHEYVESAYCGTLMCVFAAAVFYSADSSVPNVLSLV